MTEQPRRMPPQRLRRKPPGRLSRLPVKALFYGIGFPVTRLLALFGRWPRAFGGYMRRMLVRAGTYTPTDRDVLVCSYFKTGTNWTMQIALQVAYRGQAQFDHIHDLVPWIDMHPRARFAVPATDDSTWQHCPTGLRVIKTHAGFDHLAYSPKARYIWVVRDPKDVFVSSYHFIRSVALGRLMPTPAQWLDLFLSPHTPCGSWARHVDSGWRRRHEDNVLFLTYEDMKADLPAAVGQIAALMRVELSATEFASVVEQSSFAHMKAIDHKFDMIELPWTRPRGAMVRRGDRGSAGEMLDAAQMRRIDDYWRRELLQLGSDFPYDERFGRA